MTVATILSTANDGRLACNNATYLTARSGGGTLAADTTSAVCACGQELFSGQYYCYEAFFDFDTSGIPANAIISSAILSLAANVKNSTSSAAAIYRARLYDWGATLTTADWVAGASLSGLPLLAHSPAQSAISTGVYTDFTDDAMAANIVKGGNTRIIVATDRMEAATAPSSGTEYIGWRMNEQSGTATDPKLVITYTVPAGRSQAVVMA